MWMSWTLRWTYRWAWPCHAHTGDRGAIFEEFFSLYGAIVMSLLASFAPHLRHTSTSGLTVEMVATLGRTYGL